MAILAQTQSISQDIKDLIRVFMSEASLKTQLRRGVGRNQNPDTYDKAVGLVEVMVSFEAFISALKPSEPSILNKRNFFSSSYQGFFITFNESCKAWIDKLYEELQNQDLIDTTPRTKRPSIKINNKDNLSEIIEVIYRVRSNMVHGNKTLSSYRNQVLIINSFHLAYSILDHIFREEGIIT
ncbi:MAG TPA: hypothetical protein VHA12_01670 [Candidatus Nanoarchaeia archaeon]|nr:hypothetical protein [Candidatus Nanoarchaeia archaeon]